MKLGLVGATGAVGRALLGVLAARRFPFSELQLWASRESSGVRLQVGKQSYPVDEVDPEAFSGLDLIFFAAGSPVSKELVPLALQAGALVVDNSSAFREEPDVPLVVPEINAADLPRGARLVANPNCTTIINALVAAPLHRAFGLERMHVVSFQAASGAGAAGLTELGEESRAVLSGAASRHAVFPEPLAFNLIPAIGALVPGGETLEERKLRVETRKILDHPDLQVAATCVRVPVFRCHGIAATGWFRRDPDPREACGHLERAPGVMVVELPTPRACEEQSQVLVGRVRRAALGERALSWFVTGDQLLKGAAQNAVQIAEALLQDR